MKIRSIIVVIMFIALQSVATAELENLLINPSAEGDREGKCTMLSTDSRCYTPFIGWTIKYGNWTTRSKNPFPMPGYLNRTTLDGKC